MIQVVTCTQVLQLDFPPLPPTPAPNSYLHHDDADTLEEPEEGEAVLPALADGDPGDHGEHHQAQDVRGAGVQDQGVINALLASKLSVSKIFGLPCRISKIFNKI